MTTTQRTGQTRASELVLLSDAAGRPDEVGVKAANLYEGRDLAATTDLRAVLKGLLKDHLRVTDEALAANVFPGSADVKAMAGLVSTSS